MSAFKAFTNFIPGRMKILSEYNYYLEADEDPDTDENTSDLDNEDDGDNEDIDLNAPELEDGDSNADLDNEIEGGGSDISGEGIPAEGENEVEIDVTGIVAKQDEILSKYNEVIASINGLKTSYGSTLGEIKTEVNKLGDKLASTENELKQELRKRVPTPNEKLELRSMSSYPYSTKLSDYWKPADDGDEYEFSVNNPNNADEDYLDKTSKQNDEYVLKASHVQDGYNEYDIERSM